MTSSKLKVLVADDSQVIRAVFSRLALHSPIPFELVLASDGKACLELLGRKDINLAFIDVGMPEMSGIEAVGAARLAGNRTFVTLISARTSPKRLQLARALKVYEYLAKPFTDEDVLAILQTYRRVTAPLKGLIVDDSATARRIVRKVLASSIFNIEISEAEDGDSAFALCESGRFDLVFLDCNMPGLDGLETLARLKRNERVARIVMMTAERNEERRRKALDLGAAAFLYKPFSRADIDRELHALFGLKPPDLAMQAEAEQDPAADVTTWS
jgi:CheY-like chemotaxis protein